MCVIIQYKFILLIFLIHIARFRAWWQLYNVRFMFEKIYCHFLFASVLVQSYVVILRTLDI